MMYNRKSIIGLFFIGLGLATHSFAQEKRNLSIDEAIQLSINNSKSLKRTQLSQDAAHEKLQEAKNQRLPNLSASGQYMRLNSPSLKGNLLTMLAPDNSGNAPEQGSGVKVNQIALGMASANVPVFSGFRIDNGIKAAAYLEKASEFDVNQQKDAIVDNTIDAYFNLYKAQALVDLVKEHNKTALQRVKDFTNLEKNGIIPRNDLLSVQLQQKNMELSVMDAENNQKIANYNFDLMLGIPETTALSVSNPNPVVNTLNPLTEYLNQGLENRNDMKALDYKVKAAEYGTKVAKGAYWPSLRLSGSYAALDVHNMLTVNNAMNVGLGLSYSISDLYKNGTKVKQSQIQEQQAKLGLSELEDGVKMQIHKAYQDYQERAKKVDVLATAVELANENYTIVKNKYDNSLATATELLDADAGKLQAEVNFEFSKVDRMIAYNKLMLATGQLSNIYTKNK